MEHRQPRRLVSIQQAATYVNVHPKTICRWIADGLLVGYRLGPRVIRVNLNQLDAMLDRSEDLQAWKRPPGL